MEKSIDEMANFRLCEASGKRCYTRRDAGYALNSWKHHQRSDHLGRNKEHPNRVYFCDDCCSYHLTKKTSDSMKSASRYSLQTKFYMEYEKKQKYFHCQDGNLRDNK